MVNLSTLLPINWLSEVTWTCSKEFSILSNTTENRNQSAGVTVILIAFITSSTLSTIRGTKVYFSVMVDTTTSNYSSFTSNNRSIFYHRFARLAESAIGFSWFQAFRNVCLIAASESTLKNTELLRTRSELVKRLASFTFLTLTINFNFRAVLDRSTVFSIRNLEEINFTFSTNEKRLIVVLLFISGTSIF